jgi:hypothetical protein
MARIFSVYRRKNNLVDLNWPIEPGIASYKMYFSANFDTAMPTQFDTVPLTGKQSLTVLNNGFTDNQFRGKTRFLFNPDDYASSGLDDTKPIYVSLVPVNFAGVSGTASSLHLILPYSPEPNRALILNGNAPSPGPLEIQLPMLVHNMIFTNLDAGNTLNVSFEPTGPAYEVGPLATTSSIYPSTYPNASQLFIAGAGGSVAINVLASIRNNPVG